MGGPFAQAKPFQYLGRPLAGFLAADACDNLRDGYVFQGREFRQQVVILINEPQMVTSDMGAAIVS